MQEECILIDENDTAIGHVSKKTCTSLMSLNHLRANRLPSSIGHLMQNINQGMLHRAFR
jgi:isopentenyldiphosphate isomerase